MLSLLICKGGKKTDKFYKTSKNNNNEKNVFNTTRKAPPAAIPVAPSIGGNKTRKNK
jgi:hypothetical protein